jgi:hypothetical protein
MTNSQVEKMYDTILSIPGMNEAVKIDLRLDRKSVLLLSQIVERGLAAGTDVSEFGLIETVPKESIEALQQQIQECLQKSGLAELSEKLKTLHLS